MNEQRIEIVVPLPDTELNYGVHSLTHHTAARITFRHTAEWKQRNEAAAAMLGMSLTDYIRTSVMNVTKALEQRMKEKANGPQHDLRSG